MTIFINDALENVLTVPLQAVVGTPSMGAQRKVFVLAPDGTVAELLYAPGDQVAEGAELLKLAV